MVVTAWLALLPWADPVPAEEDVVAGGWGALVFVGLIIAVALLGISLNRHLRKVRDSAAAGVYGPPPTEDDKR